METFIQVNSLYSNCVSWQVKAKNYVARNTERLWDFFVLFLRWESRELRSLASPLQVSLVKGRLGTFPNYSALYLKKKLWWNGFFTAIGVFAEQVLKSNVLRNHKSSFWDEPIKQLNIYRWNREYSLYFQCPINKIVPKAGISQKEGIEFCNRWISWSGKR